MSAGIVGTQAEETSRSIAFTLFIACRPRKYEPEQALNAFGIGPLRHFA